ncbi:MAG TPA: hypothetical protein VN541_25235 [Tepidisphaeraceae bacterium]|nr:hypothetical protein [Tepidisphaeraceae bacterium]
MNDQRPTIEAALPGVSLGLDSDDLLADSTSTRRRRRILRAQAVERSLYWVCIVFLCFIITAVWLLIMASRHG